MSTKFSFEHLYYENPALWSPERYEGIDSARAQLVVQWLPASVTSVLDIGCGNGVFINQLPQTLRAVGIDRSRSALQQMNGPRCRADATSLPFPDHAFDAAVCLEVLEHLSHLTFAAALHEIDRVTQQFVLVTVPYCEDRLLTQVVCPLCNCRFHPYNHVRSFARNDLENLFAPNKSLKLVRATGILPTQSLLLPRLRLAIGRLRGRTKPFPWYATCPQCGYHHGSNSFPTKTPSEKKSSWFKRVWLKRQSFRWWIALYEKRTDFTGQNATSNESNRHG